MTTTKRALTRSQKAWKQLWPRGRGKARKGYVLHHIDPQLKREDPQRYKQWRVEDLMMMRRSEHTRLHSTGNQWAKDKRWGVMDSRRPSEMSLIEELFQVWREIPGYPQYEASDQGRVRSTFKGVRRVLKPCYQPSGAVHYNVKGSDGKMRSVKAHTLVAMAFLGYEEHKFKKGDQQMVVVHHLNLIKSDNRLVNLKLMPKKQLLRILRGVRRLKKLFQSDSK